MARWMFSRGMFSARALCTASLRRKLASGSPPPSLAATVISRVSLVKSWPRLASAAPFLRLIVAHLLCPDIFAPSTINLKDEYREHESTGKVYQMQRPLTTIVSRLVPPIIGDQAPRR